MNLQREFEERIGYQFQDKKLLAQALTHSSYANECHTGRLSDNERLEFLGDAVLELVSSEFLFKSFPEETEGEMTRLRASMVCEQTLSFCTRGLDLGRYLRLGKGEEQTGGRKRASVLSDALEAVIGAIYLDGGFANAKEFILKYILNDLEHKKLFFDSKTILQEVVQGNFSEELHYRMLRDHNKRFIMEAMIGDTAYGQGEGRTKKAAEQEAAYQTLLRLKQQGL